MVGGKFRKVNRIGKTFFRKINIMHYLCVHITICCPKCAFSMVS